MKYYVKTRFPDWVLCSCITAGMSSAIFAGFVLEDALSGSVPLTFLASFILTAVLIAFSWNRKTAGIGIILGVIAAAVIIFAQMTGLSGSGSLFLTLLILIVTGVMVYLLGRTVPGIAVMFVLGTIIQCGSHFLQFPATLWGFLIFLISVFLLFLWRRSRNAVKNALLGKLKSGGYLLQACIICLAALLLAGGVFYAVIEPLNPPTQELRLITRLKSMDLLQVLGVSSVREVLDEDITSSEDPYRDTQGNDPGEDEDEDAMNSEDDNSDSTESDLPDQVPGSEEEYSAVNYPTGSLSPLWLLLLLIPLAIIAAIVIKIYMRRRWHRKVVSLHPEESVIQYYLFFSRRLRRAGLSKPDSHTLNQYISDNSVALAVFDTGETTFACITGIYQQVLYGVPDVSEADLHHFNEFYLGFYEALHREMGTGKYMLYWFSL